ncbi:MAG: 1,4-alpha-glucan branching enzyme, partial [Lachnospiraceae bacterium]|nr:1,4-alpha-glucan branching enzyme [Lachnospiraceae bacterium]
MAAEKKDTTPFITDLDMYYFGSGTHYDIYKKLGSHPAEKDGQSGYYFAVWAPNAQEVRLIGSFNGWDENALFMTRQEPLGVYDCFVPGLTGGELYKYLIV